jgi:hypothetical protein
MRKVVAAAEAPGIPAAWATLAAKVRKRLADVDVLGTQLEKIADDHVAILVSLAERWRVKDASLAERALQTVLRLKPGHAKATELLAKVGASGERAVVSLFNGKDGKGWRWLDPPHWRVVDGVIVARLMDKAMSIRTEREFSGNYDVRMEARVLEVSGDMSMFALQAAAKSDDRLAAFGLQAGILFWDEGAGKDGQTILRQPVEDLDPPFDPRQWTVYEMRFRQDSAEALINGHGVRSMPRHADRDSGAVGVTVQHMNLEIRKVEVIPR